MSLFKRIALFISIIVVLSFCRKPTNVNWDVDLTLPVVNAELDMRNFFGDSLFTSDNTGLIHFTLNREVLAIKLDSVFKLPDTSIVNTFTVPAIFPTTLTPGQALTFFPPTELEFEFGNGVALKLFDVRKGALAIKFSNDLTEPLDLLYVIPNATKNGSVFTVFETVPPGINSLVKEYDLSGYSLNMRGLSGNAYNTIVQAYTLNVNPNANPVVVTYGKGAKAELSYSEIIPQYIEGYFGQQTLKIDADTAKFDFGNTITTSNFMLDDVTMNFQIHNQLGAEFTCNLSNINSINSVDQKTVGLNSNQLSNINLNRASKVGQSVFPSVKPISFTKANSNIVPFISNLPNKLTYQGDVQLNPLGNVSGYNDFAFYDTGLSIIAQIDIPLRYTADYFLLSTNSPANFGNSEQLDRVNGGVFLINAENGFPFSTQLQVYLKDEQNQLLDSVFVNGENIIQAGQINASNEVIAPTKSQILIPVNKTMTEALKKTRSVDIKSYFKMPPNPPLIKILEKYKFKINIIAELGYNVEI